jgi:hypothetical protein
MEEYRGIEVPSSNKRYAVFKVGSPGARHIRRLR